MKLRFALAFNIIALVVPTIAFARVARFIEFVLACGPGLAP